jgi:hypothetical protein
MRISIFCAVSSTLAALAFSVNCASAETLTIHSATPKVNVHLPTPKVGTGKNTGGKDTDGSKLGGAGAGKKTLVERTLMAQS